MVERQNPAQILIVDSTDAVAHALETLPYTFNRTDFRQLYDLIIVRAPVSAQTWRLIQDYNPETPLIVLAGAGDAEASTRAAQRPNTQVLAEPTPAALALQIERMLGEAFHHGSPPIAWTLRRHSDELSTLYAITEAISQPLDPQETMVTALDTICEHTDYTSGAIVFYDAATQELKPVAWRDVPQHYLDAFAHLPPDSHRLKVVQTGEPVFIPDIAAASAQVGRDISYGTNCVSSLILPLQARGRTLGLLVLGSAQPHTFPPQERALLMGVARALGTAIDTAQIVAQEQRRAAELALLSDVGFILQDTSNLEDALRRALERVCQTLPFDALAVGKINLSSNGMTPLSTYNTPASLERTLHRVVLPAEHLTWDAMIRDPQPQTFTDFGAHLRTLDPECDVPPETTLTLVPLFAHDVVQGVLLLFRFERRQPDDSERRILNLIAQRIGLALENAQLYEEMRQRAHEVTALLATTETVSSNLDLNTRLEIITERAKRLIKADGVVLYLLQDDGETLRPQVVLHPQADRMRAVTYRLGEGLSGRVALLGQGEIINDAPAHLQDYALPPGVDVPAALLSIPMRVEGHVLGVVTLMRSKPGAPFHNSDLRLLAALANQAAIAIENVRLFDESHQQRRFAETLSRVSRLVSATFDLDKVLDTVLRELRSVIEYDSAHIRLIEGEEMRVAHHIGYPADPPPRLLSMDVSALNTSRLILRSQQCLVIPDTHKFEGWQPLEGTEYVRSWIGVPLISRGRVIGILVVDHRIPNAYSERHGPLVTAFANQIAATIDNARLFQQTEARERESRTLYEVTRALVALDARSIPAYVLDKLQDAIHFDVGGILVAGEPERLVVRAASPVSDQTLRKMQDRLVAYYEGLGGAAVNPHALETTVIGDAQVSSALPPEDLPSHLAAPLIVANNLIGCIQVASVVPDVYGEKESRTLYTIATQTATALDSARLYESLKQSLQSLQQAYDELAEVDRLKDELVQNVSHEIRTPLTFIKSYVDLLVEGDMGALTPEQIEALEVVARKTNVLKGLVDDIISLKRIDADTLDLQLLDLGELVRHAAEAFTPAAVEQGLSVVTDIAPGLPLTMGDPDRLGQVLDNLLGNARKFSPTGTTITVRVLDSGPRLRVEVEDQGIGIPEDKQARIFERFYQVDGSIRRRYGGAGLGLAISRQIIEAHNGVIGVRSRPGEGSLFYFELYKARP